MSCYSRRLIFCLNFNFALRCSTALSSALLLTGCSLDEVAVCGLCPLIGVLNCRVFLFYISIIYIVYIDFYLWHILCCRYGVNTDTQQIRGKGITFFSFTKHFLEFNITPFPLIYSPHHRLSDEIHPRLHQTAR